MAKDKKTKQFVTVDAGTFKKVEDTFGELLQHIDEQPIEPEKKQALTIIADGFKARINAKKDHFHNFTMLSQAVYQVNQYL